MTALSKTGPTGSARLKMPAALREEKNLIFRRRSRFAPSDYECLIDLFRKAGYEIVRLCDVFCDPSLQGKKLFSLRHDVDHDWETALRIAAWEHARGYRSTYCVLHTDWYYGEFVDGKYVHYDEFIDFCHQLEQMGHEINLHNNFVTLALTTGFDLRTLIADEVHALRSYSINLVGTSTHGDALCDKLKYYNLEAFEGRAWDSKGGTRPVSLDDVTVHLGSVSMEALDLRYEAYDYPRDLYITDSGGRLRLRRNTRGLRGFRRKDGVIDIPSPSNCGLLTHPIWWDFEEPRLVIDIGIAARMLDVSGLSEEVLAGEVPHQRPPIQRQWSVAEDSAHYFIEPRHHRELLDHILYMAPSDLQLVRLAPIFTEDQDRDAFRDAWGRYESTVSDAARDDALCAYLFSTPNPDLIVEFFETNRAKLLTRHTRGAPLDYSAIGASLLSLATAFDVSRDKRFLHAAMAIGEGVLADDFTNGDLTDEKTTRISSLGAVGRVAYPLLKLAYIARRHALSEHAKLGHMYDALREHVLDFDEDLVDLDDGALWYREPLSGRPASFADVSALACAQLMIALCENDAGLKQRVGRLWTFFRSHWSPRGDGTVGWASGPEAPDASPAPVSSMIWPALFASECVEHQVAAKKRDINEIVRCFLTQVPELGSGDECHREISEALLSRLDGGFSYLLAWWPFGRDRPDLADRLTQIAREPELGNWFRHPWAVLAYAERMRPPAENSWWWG